jgi:hypothetical protein
VHGSLLVCLAILAIPAMVHGGQTAPRQRQPASRPASAGPIPASAMVVGRVTTTDTGAPIRGAEVRLRATDGRENRLVTTDAEGRFQIVGLVAGEWTLTASKAGFISQQFGQLRPFQGVANIQLAIDQRFTAELRLTRAGAIAGHVFNEFGEPIAGARVQAMRTRMVRGRRTSLAVGVGDQTDDTGAFRLYALAPGEYYVGASLRTAPAENTIIDSAATTPTYFPGTPNLGEATRITLGLGEEQANVDFTVQPVRAIQVAGVLLTSSGAPAPEGSFVNLISGDVNSNGMPLGNAGVIRSGGNFVIPNVSPGSYILTAALLQSGPENIERASLPITVGTDPVIGLNVVMTKASTLTGGVVSENNAPLPADFSYNIQGRSVSPASTEMSMGNTTRSSFRLAGFYGPTAITVQNLPEGWMLKSIDIDGQDVTDTPFDFRGQQNLTARVVVTDRVTALSGVVRAQRQPAANAEIVLFPEDPAKWTFPNRYVQSTRADPQGRFTLRAVPPESRYLVVAVDYLEDGETQDPEFLERIKERSKSLSIDFGERKTIELDLVER